MSFVQSFDPRKALNNSQFSSLFSNGLFGAIDEIHPLTGYLSGVRAGFNLAFDGADSFLSNGLFGDYGSLCGSMLSFDQLPQGYFFDDDGDASTEALLIAALKTATGFQEYGPNVASGVPCLAGVDAIDDLAKFNLSFFIDPTGFNGDQFTLRYASSLVSAEVPEPGVLALLMPGLGALGVTARRRRAV